MTLIPLLCAFRKAVEMPSLFSHAAAMTSTPSVIQFSTISFCLAGSVSVGPSKINSSPSSFAAFWAPWLQEMKYALPFDFGNSAMVNFFCAGAGLGLAPLSEVGVSDFLQPEKTATAVTRKKENNFFMDLSGNFVRATLQAQSQKLVMTYINVSPADTKTVITNLRPGFTNPQAMSANLKPVIASKALVIANLKPLI